MHRDVVRGLDKTHKETARETALISARRKYDAEASFIFAMNSDKGGQPAELFSL